MLLRSPASRLLLPVFLCVLLGALTTFAVAWASSLRVKRDILGAQSALRRWDGNSGTIWVDRYDRPCSFEIECNSGAMIGEFIGINESPGAVDALVPKWMRPLAVPWDWNGKWPDGGPHVANRTIRVLGWPRPCMWCSIESGQSPPGTNVYTIHSGLRIPDGFPFISRRPNDPPAVLPWRVRLSPFAFNAAIFASGYLVLFAVLTPLVRWRGARRLRAGVCPRCRYDVRGLPPESSCPECGAPSAPQR